MTCEMRVRLAAEAGRWSARAHDERAVQEWREPVRAARRGPRRTGRAGRLRARIPRSRRKCSTREASHPRRSGPPSSPRDPWSPDPSPREAMNLETCRRASCGDEALRRVRPYLRRPARHGLRLNMRLRPPGSQRARRGSPLETSFSYYRLNALIQQDARYLAVAGQDEAMRSSACRRHERPTPSTFMVNPRG